MRAEPPPILHRPAVWVNCAASLDGRLAFADGVRARLSSPEDLVRVQRLRANADAILVGVGTVVKDDPSLRVHWELLNEPPRAEPTRVVLDSRGRIPPGARVLDGSAPTIVAVSEQCDRRYPPTIRSIIAGKVRVDLAELFGRLPALGIHKLMVEGGSEVISSVLRAGLFDRLTVYYAPVVIGGRTAPPIAAGGETRSAEEEAQLSLQSVERVGEGYVATYTPSRAPPPA